MKDESQETRLGSESDISMEQTERTFYNEIGRYSSYGTARKKAKDLEKDNPKQSHYIFKDISNGPFTSMRDDAYILAEKVNDVSGGSK